MNENYAIVQMLQSYESSKLQDIGKKTLYLQKDDRYNWKIVAEHWEKVKPVLHPDEVLEFVDSL